MKHVTLVVPDGEINLNSLAGAYEILTRADDYWQRIGNPPKLKVQIAGFVSELPVHQHYFAIHPGDIRQIKKTDLLIIPSLFGDYEELIRQNSNLIDWISRQYRDGAEIASMCSGAFLLAATGLLDDRLCSTHWNVVSEFHERFPRVRIAADKIITDENGIYTNGGGYSFLNLMLYLVEKIFDRPTAIFCSKIFQIDIERTTQSPFTIFHVQKSHGDDIISRAQQYIEDNIEEKISFEKLAIQLAISRRNFDRRFVKATGNTPVEYLQRVKIEAAKKELEKGRKTVFEVMSDVGYTDDKAFREVFKKITGLSPMDYRHRYSKAG
ncbi:GlxA family transcriptional regulator [Flavihumibacter petaseus]|uniref:Putative AraC family transcriptional regulator n=1 Tax=Flavihumibacter petaseus NBRC 106054 TaxID=1220578 RepID=A0A0E9N1T1_9BACT|nr:helix-turn-helix domain-containing protein [Flavihumibacter petaseus]GAO43972.1 putative AraC family transcriptional regulator [Flavihumibacter petaseus NBRC 106054]